MSYKIYMIKHLDTDMKYVGITGGDLATRWQQHYSDINSAVYKALRTEGYRMTMELLEEVATKPEALKREQEYIRSLGTATPSGWNRQVKTPLPPNPRKWIKYSAKINIIPEENIEPYLGSLFRCPACACEFTHTGIVEVYNRNTEDELSIRHVVLHLSTKTTMDTHKENPSRRRQGMRIYFTCESCHSLNFIPHHLASPPPFDAPPRFEILIYQQSGNTFFETEYYIEDKS